MKFLLVLCFLSLVVLSTAVPQEYHRGCIYILGKCIEECPEGTSAYTTGCSPVLPEATCDKPNPKKEDYDTCDFSACYCDPPTVRDTKTNKCVTRDKCPKKEEEKNLN